MSAQTRTVVWSAEHMDWVMSVTIVQGDALPHVVIHGEHPATGLLEAHADRIAGATPASVRRWVESVLAGPGGVPA